MSKYISKNSFKHKYKRSFATEIGNTRSIFYTIFSNFFYTSLIILIFITILWFFRQIDDTEKFGIHRLEFTAPLVRANSNMVKKISLSFTKQNFFTVNIFELKKRLSQLPWVHEVTILRTWPNGLSIHIKEQEAIARLPNNHLLNQQLEIFTVPIQTMPQYLPEFNGPAGQLKVMWQNYQAIEAILKPLGLHVIYFELSERQSWRLTLNNHLKLVLGRSSGLDHLKRFVEIYNQIITPQNMGMIDCIDLRYPNGVAVHTQQFN
jgi:cell division septal protein FtsQ